MGNHTADKTVLVFVGPRFPAIVITTMLLLIGFSNHAAAGQADTEGKNAEPAEGQIWNITDAPFTFQLHRATGNNWTQEITLAPGKFRPVLATDTDLLGVTNDGKQEGYVVVRYPTLGGHVQVMLSARTRNEQFVPYWFYVKDSSGISRLIQATSREKAEVIRKRLLGEPPKSEQEIEQIKRTLRANWVLYD